MTFEDEMKTIQNSYNRRFREATKASLKIWEGYDSEEKALTNQVDEAFRKVLDEIGPVVTHWAKEDNPDLEPAVVEKYTVEYLPQWNEFKIKINKIDKMDPHTFDENCPHVYLGPITGLDGNLHPKIKEFVREYHVRFISNPDNYYEHK